MSNRTIAARWRGWAPDLLSLLRIVTAFLFVQEGTSKWFKYPHSPVHLHPSILVTIAGPLEVVAGTLLFLGLFTRPLAFLVAGEMAVAYFNVHAPRSFWPVTNSGIPVVMFCFVWLYISAAGAGAWSLDRRRRAEDSAVAEAESVSHR